MAIDRAVQLSVEAGEQPPTLRLYQWQRPTVTLGRFQSAEGVDLDYCRDNGIDVVRRFTGGRGVLHDDELTYCVVAGTKDGIPRGVAASYRHLSEVLAEAYVRLGVTQAAVTQRDSAPSASSACYLATTRADLSAGAHKLSGSAQVWSGSTVMQHGSFTISRDVDREAQVFRLSTQEAADLAAHTLTFIDALGRRVSIEEIQQASIGAFADVLGAEFELSDLAEAERSSANALMHEVVVCEK
ncbi:MAG TPA: biotin/lipoate A/B protein ligase family protein [Coriobacteriia bacterium]|nr:biotin/lipoate A/B protein ligase family protein [Coriobacteriia bacterium]